MITATALVTALAILAAVFGIGGYLALARRRAGCNVIELSDE